MGKEFFQKKINCKNYWLNFAFRDFFWFSNWNVKNCRQIFFSGKCNLGLSTVNGKQGEYYGNQYSRSTNGSGLRQISDEVLNSTTNDNHIAEEPFAVQQKVEEVPKKQPPKSENRTDSQVAKTAGVSRDTIRKVEKIQESATLLSTAEK